MAKVLLAGESWISSTTEYKGFDSFTSTRLEIGCQKLLDALRAQGHEVTHLLAHDVQRDFPTTMEELRRYDVVLLSDIGSNSLLLSSQVFDQGRPMPNRMALLRDWVKDGGGLMMAGGYLSFGGFEGKAHYAGTPVEQALPVSILPYDDRVEAPQGVTPRCVAPGSIADGLGEFPAILGYQRATAKPDSEVLMRVGDEPLLITGSFGAGRSLAYMSDVAPHWAPEQFMDWPHYGEFFSRCIDWLAGKD
ncbi:glutamine amidotransferase [Bifidobacterium sp. ESL0763]|uniref:glutamine amidotransferase n=1 Tax=Bifidobacterium sp. ESL0763 TaxID=2983227 RepID=UPI0023F88414|nr:glutamine amidotransferase [Bifidobacterium sp. ESL0763]MDF7664075.1 glutamine amidotransferase [Bifidobacterium sp. ESL0763]